MILIFGGTTEGRRAVQVLEEAGKPFWYSTRGNEQDIPLVNGMRITGGMDVMAMRQFVADHAIRLIIDAAHPFATLLHTHILQAAHHCHIPVIRYERQYPPHDQDICWCDDYNDAIHQLKKEGITRLLALTGVQTIEKLQGYWKTASDTVCWFRILDRDQSRDIAQRYGFPADHLVYYEKENTLSLIQKLQPQAILTKESGVSGGYQEKVSAARLSNTRLFVVKRPAYPPLIPGLEGVNVHTVNGPHGLRLKIQQLLPSFYELHTGLTTGTCATAAAVGALTQSDIVNVRIPDGEDIEVSIGHITGNTATVIKHAGDDPDITDGLEIQATVTITDDPEQKIIIRGGEGVGKVTLPGLGLPIGGPAINETPQKMIRENLLPLLDNHQGAVVTITVPAGREIGEKTFNPRVGVIDGISIVGTSGIVKPFSADAWMSSIRKEMSVGLSVVRSMNESPQPEIVINSGAKSERFMRQQFPHLPLQAFIHYGNFIGETIHMAHELGVHHLAMGVMIGKAVKLAEGNLDTHSHKVTLNKAYLQQMAHEAGCEKENIEKISKLTLARELWTMLSETEMEKLATVILRHCHEHCAPLLPEGTLDILLISDEGKIIHLDNHQ